MRLDRLLGREGLGTRSELKKAIRAGRAVVNGIPEKDPGRQITEADEVLFAGKRVGQTQYVYYMLYKPAGVITATEDGRERTVLDLLREPTGDGSEGTSAPEPLLRKGLFPVGRLDKDTEGLLLVTDDGQLAHRLLSPKKHVDKTYYAVVTGRVTEEEIRQFAEGLRVGPEDSTDSFTALPAKLRVAGEDVSGIVPPGTLEYTQVLVTVMEGKYHQIKRMFAAVGKEVLYLKRLSMGPLQLDPALAPGEFRELTGAEKELLFTD